MPHKILQPKARWTLGYPLPFDKRMFYRIQSNRPVLFAILDQENRDLALSKDKDFVSFGGGPHIHNQEAEIQLPYFFKGETVFFIIENGSNLPADVTFEAGGFVHFPTYSGSKPISSFK